MAAMSSIEYAKLVGYSLSVSKREPAVRDIAHVVGANAQQLRGKRKLDEVARAVTACGLKWGGGRISDLEAGRVSPTLPTLLVLCQAFGDLLGRSVRLAELLAGDGAVVITEGTPDHEGLHVPLSAVRAALTGSPVDLPKPHLSALEVLQRDHVSRFAAGDFHDERSGDLDPQLAYDVWCAFGEAETRTARALDVDKVRLVETMTRLWGRSLAEERDLRTGPDATQQQRGRTTRQLREELRKAIARGND